MFHIWFAIMFSTPQTSTTTTRRYRHEKTDDFDARPLARPRQRSCCFLAGHHHHQEDHQEEDAQEKEGRHQRRLGAATAADIEIRWPLGRIEKLSGLAADQLVWVTEGAGNTRTEKFPVRRG